MVSSRLILVEPGSDKASTAIVRRGTLTSYAAREANKPTYEGVVELRPFVGQQVYVDGEPVGDPFK